MRSIWTTRNKQQKNLKQGKKDNPFWAQNSFLDKSIMPSNTLPTHIKYESSVDTTVSTKNMFIESHYELNISLFERKLTVDIINAAYLKLLNEHVACIQKGIASPFDIKAKQEARDYLIKSLENTIKP